jgi:hypothetical protein
MDQATLERLMLDEALGALPADVSSLLAAYAQTLPGGGERLAVWQQVAATAKAAMPAEPAAVLPPFPARNLVSNPWRIGPVGLAAAAAALLIGVGIGLWTPRRPAAAPQVAIVPQSIVAETPSNGGVHDFWSSQRLLASAMEEKHTPSAAWRWSSPVSEPEMEGPK